MSMFVRPKSRVTVKNRVELHDIMELISCSIGRGSIYSVVEAIIKEGSINCSFTCEIGKGDKDFKVDIQPTMKISELQKSPITVFLQCFRKFIDSPLFFDELQSCRSIRSKFVAEVML